jgi:succinyl-diaminopimelate desuccinylase
MTHDAGRVPRIDATAREELYSLAERLLGVDTQNPPGNTASLVDLVEDYLDPLDLDVDRYATDPAKPNLQAVLPGTSDRSLCYQGHADTVPFDAAEWRRDPLGEWDGDRLYGRGATDMKGTLAAMIVAIEAFAQADARPPVTLRLCVVSDEETAGNAGLAALVEAGRAEVDGCVIGETTCESGRHSVTVADRGSIWLTVSADGEAAHGSRPMLGTNAIDRLYDAVAALREHLGSRSFSLDPELEPIVAESVEYYAPTIGASAARKLFEYPTVNLGTIDGGSAINTVPERARAEIDIRLTAGVETADVLAEIRDYLSGRSGVSIADVSWSVGSYEPVDSPLVDAVADTAETVTGERIYRRSATGGGDAKALRHAGVPTVEFGLGTDTAHAVDEYTTRDALVGNAEVFAALPGTFAAVHGA